jgi:pyruvate/2-oxoglutarate dehydrogenase complex dihydrolipoamide dehydrogenase (E3) component
MLQACLTLLYGKALNMNVENYKNVIIGSGEGGKFLSWHLAMSGQKTAVVERRWIGGSCPNINCLPSKNEIWSAKVADLIHHAGRFGITTGPMTVDMAGVRKRKREMVEGLVAMHLDRYKATGVELIMGEAKLTGPKTIEVRLNDGGARTLVGERIFLNLGTHAAIPPVPGLAESAPLTHIEALELGRLPEHLIVIGGGYVGLEFAQAYRRFGSQVTIIQSGSQLLPNADADVSAEITGALADEGIVVITNAEILGVMGRSSVSVSLVVRSPIGERTIQGTDILVAVGRVPNTAGIGLEAAGVALDPRRYVQVNDRLETTAPNIWAIGECAGSPQFTHVSLDDFRVIRDNLAGGRRSTRDRMIPSCLFTDPQVAHIGITEKEARSRGVAVRVATVPMMAVLRTRTLGETRGFMKALIAEGDDRILGFAMVGPEAGEVLAIAQMAMLAGLPFTVLRDAILTHPTMAEGLNALFSSIQPASAGAARAAHAPSAVGNG